MSDPGSTPSADAALRSVREFVASEVEEDIVGVVGEFMMGQSTKKPHFLLIHHPLWCGLLTTLLNLGLWDAGIECNASIQHGGS